MAARFLENICTPADDNENTVCHSGMAFLYESQHRANKRFVSLLHGSSENPGMKRACAS